MHMYMYIYIYTRIVVYKEKGTKFYSVCPINQETTVIVQI